MWLLFQNQDFTISIFYYQNERIFVLGDAEADSSKLVAGSLFDSQTELEYEV